MLTHSCQLSTASLLSAESTEANPPGTGQMGINLPRNALAAFLLLPPHLQGTPSTPQSISCTLLYPTATLQPGPEPGEIPQPELPDGPSGSVLTKLSLEISQERKHLPSCSFINSKGFSSHFYQTKKCFAKHFLQCFWKYQFSLFYQNKGKKKKKKKNSEGGKGTEERDSVETCPEPLWARTAGNPWHKALDPSLPLLGQGQLLGEITPSVLRSWG